MADGQINSGLSVASKQALRFVHLRVHSAYSLLEGALQVPKVIDLAVANKAQAIAITDTNNLFGALDLPRKSIEGRSTAYYWLSA